MVKHKFMFGYVPTLRGRGVFLGFEATPQIDRQGLSEELMLLFFGYFFVIIEVDRYINIERKM